MKFVIALVSYLESLGYDTSSLRKSADGSKAIVHMQYAEILSKNLDTNANVTIYDRVNPDFQALLASDEWNGNVTGTPNSFGDLAELAKYEARLTAQVTEAKTDMDNFQIEIAGEVTTAKEDLNTIVDNYQVTVNQQLEQKAAQVDLDLTNTLLTGKDDATNDRIDNLIIPSGNTDAEVSDARQDYLGITKPLLINRLDSDMSIVTGMNTMPVDLVYDVNGRLSTVTERDTGGNPILQTLIYYNSDGSLQKVVDKVGAKATQYVPTFVNNVLTALTKTLI